MKKFRPLSTPFIICLVLISLISIGFVYLGIIGILQSNIFYILSAIIVLMIYIIECFKIFTWKLIFTNDYLYIPNSIFNRYMINEKKEQKIYYSDIASVELAIRPVQIITITSNNNELNFIYVKQFSKKQVYNIISELEYRVKNDTVKDQIKKIKDMLYAKSR